jgi:hypothetical protein
LQPAASGFLVVVLVMIEDWKKAAVDAWSAESWKVATRQVSRSEPISPDQEYQGNASADQNTIETKRSHG